MSRIYGILLEALEELQPALERIELKDQKLAEELRRSSSSVAHQLAECQYSRGGNRDARYRNALGSARETLSCLELAVVSNYLPKDAPLHDKLDRVVGTLQNLVTK